MPVLATQREHPKTAHIKILGWLRFFLERDEIRLRYIMYNFTQKDDKSKYVLFFSREQWNIILFISIELGFHKGKLNISLFVELENCNQRIWSQSWDYLSYMEDTVVTNGRWLLKISRRIPPAAELVFVPPLRKLVEFLGRCPEWIQCQRSNIGNSVKIPFFRWSSTYQASEDYSREKVDLISQDFRSVISEKEDKGSKGDVTRTTTTCYISIRAELAVDMF